MSKEGQIQAYANSINKYLDARIEGDPKILYDAARHLIVNGGKRLRPYMVIKSCQILGGTKSMAMVAAGAVEMIHNFTLVHDDIMDNDEMRHGVTTVHKKFGMPIAILAGDVLFSKAYHSIARSNLSTEAITQLTGKMAKACVDICEGQLLDIKMADDKRIPTQSQYITMISKKTAALFEVSCAMGAICATDNQKDVSRLASFGRNLGIAFQITDDIIGVMGNPKITKKPVGNDLREGKKSLPILMAIKCAKGTDRKIIMNTFGKKNATREELKRATDAIKKLGIEQDVRGQAIKYARSAEKALDRYSGTAKDEMVSLLNLVVDRSL